MAIARPFTRPKTPEVARLRDEARANVDALERKAATLEARVAKLERVAAYVRDDLYAYLISLAAAVPFAAPPEPPDR